MIQLIISMIIEADLMRGTWDNIKKYKTDTIEIYKVGMPLLIVGLVSTLILNLDRQFVSALFSKQDFARYSFAYSLT